MSSSPKKPPYDRTSHLIARAPQTDISDWNRPFITYSPPTVSDSIPWIGVNEGATPHDSGGECSPQHVLERPCLLKIIEDCGASWFLPFIRRLAGGSDVSVEEIASEYRQRHRREIERKEWGVGWFPSVREAYNRAHRIGEPVTRDEFVAFVLQVATGSYSDADWQRMAITHYCDDQMEDARRKLVRFVLGSPPPKGEALSLEQHLLSIAAALKNGCR